MPGTQTNELAPLPPDPLNPPASKPPTEDPTLTHLAKQVADREYTVDSHQVAEEIIRKLRMIKWARQELVNEHGRIREPKLRGL